MRRMKQYVAAGCMAAGLAVGVGATAVPAASAQPVITGGLVNITITDVLTNNQVNVQVPIGIAANVCGVAANVLASGNFTSPVDCTSATTASLPAAFRR